MAGANKAAAAKAAAAAAKPAVADAEAAPPAGDLGGTLTLIERLLPAECQPIFDLFDADFHLYEVWNAFEAVAVLGRKAEAFLTGSGGPRFGATQDPALLAVIPAHTVGTAELCEQLKMALDEAKPVTAAAGDAEAGAAPSVEMNPLLAGLVLALAKRVAEELITRLGGWLRN